MNWNPPRWVPIYLMIFENRKFSDHSKNFFCLTIHKKTEQKLFLGNFFFVPKKFFVSLKKLLLKFYEVRSERGISIDTDPRPLGYVLWCCVSGSRGLKIHESTDFQSSALFFSVLPSSFHLWSEKELLFYILVAFLYCWFFYKLTFTEVVIHFSKSFGIN